MSRSNVIWRKIRNDLIQKKLKNKTFSLFSNNCNGGCICHDLGVGFRSPFVNLWLTPGDFIRFLGEPERYLAMELMFIEEPDCAHPVAMLGDVKLYFQHYESAAEAAEQWNRRKARINWDNLFVLMSERDGCTMEDLERFDALPYPNKAVLTHIPYPSIKSAVYIPGFEEQQELGVCSEFVDGFSGRKYYDAFDYVKWFNEGKHNA